MKRGHVITALIAVLLVGALSWVASVTEWEEVTVPMPPRGEALVNPFYATQRYAEALGARATWDRLLTVPSTDAVIVLSSWHWTLGVTRREQLERWVEAGGRLMVDDTLSGGEEEFARWSGIARKPYGDDEDDEDDDETDTGSTFEFQLSEKDRNCRVFEERPYDTVPGDDGTGPAPTHVVCGVHGSHLTTSKPVVWAVRDVAGMQAVRVRVGRGSVTVINAAPFRMRELFKGDHGWLFAAATQLRPNDEVHFLSEREHPSLLALMWTHGAPVVLLSLVLVGLALWRGGVRFGPLAAPEPAARRSLAEQIRGTGQFALRHGRGVALLSASVRALEEAAERRVRGYARLPGMERASALARLTGLNRKALATAIHQSEHASTQDLRRTIALLETARRQTLVRTGSEGGLRPPGQR